jgi:K+-sensing histidine kinase KdpD
MMWILDTVPLFLGIVFHIAGRNEDSFLNIQFNLSRLASQKTAEAQHAHQLEILLNSLLSTAIKDLSLKEQLQQSLEIVLSCPSLTISQKGGIFLADEHRPESLRLAVYKNVDAATLNTFQGCTREDHANQPERPTSDELYHVPIMLGKETLGMIVLFTETGHVQTAREARFLEAVANTLAGIIHRDRLERHIYLQRLTLESTEV